MLMWTVGVLGAAIGDDEGGGCVRGCSIGDGGVGGDGVDGDDGVGLSHAGECLLVWMLRFSLMLMWMLGVLGMAFFLGDGDGVGGDEDGDGAGGCSSGDDGADVVV